MARASFRLTAMGIRHLKEPGRHVDGDGLALLIGEPTKDGSTGRRRWTLRYRHDGKQFEVGLGTADGPAAVTLAEARKRAADIQASVKQGEPPHLTTKTSVPTFGDVADDVVAARRAGLTSKIQGAQWARSLGTIPTDPDRSRTDNAAFGRRTAALAALRAKPVDGVTTDDVVAVLRPIWTVTPETASRTRQRIEIVLDAAKARGLRTGDNPARWRDSLAYILPPKPRREAAHHGAMAFAKLPAFWRRLDEIEAPSMPVLILQFAILTATRWSEAAGARWSEIDGETAVWAIPAVRMKQGRTHRVPLSAGALAVLQRVALLRRDGVDLVFVGHRNGKAFPSIGSRSKLNLMMNGATAHGMRSTFRDWAGEMTDHAREVAEAALAHQVGNAVEAAYRRGDALAKRRVLMDDWSAYVTGKERSACA
ncbi:tyrosine-type recombinase/integrase [Siculibacillus lacustris]|nr:site-specific integrase [Siculibacillus lacustris]